jgi:hypothetical protein
LPFKRKLGGLTYQLVKMSGAVKESDTYQECRTPLVMPTPKPGNIGFAFTITNLLVTTLAVVATALPPGQQAYASAPAISSQPQTDAGTNNQLVLIPTQSTIPPGAQLSGSAVAARAILSLDTGTNNQLILIPAQAVQPPGDQIFSSAFQSKYQVFADQPQRSIALIGAAPPPLPPGQQLLGSAPASRYLGSDLYPNLVIRVAAAATPPVRQLSDSAPITKYQIQVDVYTNYILTGIPTLQASTPLVFNAPRSAVQPFADVFPNFAIRQTQAAVAPTFQQVSLSAPALSRPVLCDQYPNGLPLNTVAYAPCWNEADERVEPKAQVFVEQRVNRLPLLSVVVAPFTPVNASQLQIKYQVQADQSVNRLTLGVVIQPPGDQWMDSAPQAKGQVFSQNYSNTLTLVPVALTPPVLQLSQSAPIVHYAVECEQYVNTLLLGYPTLAPGWIEFDELPQSKPSVSVDQPVNVLPLHAAQVAPPPVLQLSTSAPPPKFAVEVDVYPNLVVQTVVFPPLLPNLSEQTFASAPQIKQPPLCDQYVNTLLLGIALPGSLVPNLSEQIFASAPAIKFAVTIDPPQNLLDTTLATPLLPVDAIDQFASAPAVKYQPPLCDQYINLVLLLPVAPSLLPNLVDQVFASAPMTKFAVQADQYPNPLVRGINPPPKTVQWSESSPRVKYPPLIDQYPNTLARGINPPPRPMQLSDSAPWVKYRPQVDISPITIYVPANVTPPVTDPYYFENPLIFLEDFGITVTYGPYTLRGILSQPGQDLLGGRIESTQYELMFLTSQMPGVGYGSTLTIGGTVFTVLGTLQLDDGEFSTARMQGDPSLNELYTFEAFVPTNFLGDFGVTATVGATSALVILSEPGQDILGGTISSTQYEIEYITSQLTLTYGSIVTIGTQSFTVLQTYLVDDGKFSRARLES